MLDFLVNSIRLSFLWTSWFIKLELCELDEYCRWREKGLTVGQSPGQFSGSVSHGIYSCFPCIWRFCSSWSQAEGMEPDSSPRERTLQELQWGRGAITLKRSCLVYQLRGHKVTFLSFLHQPFFLLPGRVQICSPHCSSSYIFRVCSNVGASTTPFNHLIQRSAALAPPPLLP